MDFRWVKCRLWWWAAAVLFSDQMRALQMLKSGEFRRPLLKTMRSKFGEGVSLYGGRKGFPDLMLSLEQKIENISVWMGHSTIDRTWRSYKDKKRFHLNCA